MATDSADSPDQSFTATITSWTASHASAFVILAAALYGVALYAHDTFYSKFGIKPEEVGLGYLVILPRAMIAVAVYGGFLLALLSIVALIELFIRSPTKESSPSSTEAAVRWGRRKVVPWFRKRVSIWAGEEWTDRPPKLYRQLRFATIASALVILLAVIMTNIADGRVTAVRAGKAVQPTAVSFLSVRASRVKQFDWVGAQVASLNLAHKIMYFGSADGISVFYDVDSRTVLRIPSSTFVLLTETPHDTK